jgi:CheY-like chemotaxis protein
MQPGAPPFDVVVMDLQMPIMDGMEALKRLRAAEYAMQQAESTSGASSASIVTAMSVQHGSSLTASGFAPVRPPLPLSIGNGQLSALSCPGHVADTVDLEGGEGSLLPPLPSLPAITRRSNANSSASSADRRGRFHQYVLAVSANSDHETVQAALDAGADGFISKPFTYDSFTEAMQQRGCSR